MKGLAFYEAAAQIIPVLLLVLVFEARLFQLLLIQAKWRDHLLVGLFFAAIAAGQTTCLVVLYVERDTMIAPVLVSGAIGLEGVAIIFMSWRGGRVADVFNRREIIMAAIASLNDWLESIDESNMSEEERRDIASLKRKVAKLERRAND
jgi:hypothetical protein